MFGHNQNIAEMAQEILKTEGQFMGDLVWDLMLQNTPKQVYINISDELWLYNSKLALRFLQQVLRQIGQV